MLESTFREFRHNPCLMGPLTFFGVLLVCLLWLFAFVWKFPIFMLGYLMSPILNRTQFIIEFFYPLSLGRMVHLSICRMVQRSTFKGSTNKSADKNRGFHSRSVETRIEVIPHRLYIHPLPQLIDNLGYLVVCVPDGRAITVVDSSTMGKISSITQQHGPSQIVAFLVDCGDADAVVEQIGMIREVHYDNQKISVQSILSTHKHHDHTAGNIPFRRKRAYRDDFKIIVGGAVEKIPGCNYTVADGDLVPLPCAGTNNMADFIEVEAVATPAHTRGSITYALCLKPDYCTRSSPLGFLFTGDTMFSAGGGVPFEADLDPGQEQKEVKKTFTSIVKASASLYAVERCFAEILARALKFHSTTTTEGLGGWDSTHAADKTFIMPGHEYTHELLSRQLAAGNVSENCRWKNFTPHVFFETASQLYVALHRRSLPHSSGKLITAMASPVSAELIINPYFRNMKKRGEIIIQAVSFWNKHFARTKVPTTTKQSQQLSHSVNGYANGRSASTTLSNNDKYYSRSTSLDDRWTLDVCDLARPVFTTVYSADLDLIIRDLDQGTVSPQEGAQRLVEMKQRLKEGLVTRRPVPASLPSDRAVYRGLLALALLGSSPTALTFSDSRRMNLPPPVVKSSDQLQISKGHLISVLQWLGLLSDEKNGRQIMAMIHQLWKETLEDSPTACQQKMNNKSPNYDTIDDDPEGENPHRRRHHPRDDLVDLGDLKWQLYGVPRQQSAVRYCMPCAKPRRVDPHHPAHQARMQPHSGEIVRHDILTCPVCRTRAGCPYLASNNNEGLLEEEAAHANDDDNDYEVSTKSSRQVVASIGSLNDDDDAIYVEVTSILKEA